ncbi:hypothetical protein QQF64_013688 [Cirrhinus molitorella]|uniref:Uncharacterized protein n=1 Tax=Cirrhinus molitorella TaxID=172907 RepID=A0ABR3LVF5_9TELE
MNNQSTELCFSPVAKEEIQNLRSSLQESLRKHYEDDILKTPNDIPLKIRAYPHHYDEWNIWMWQVNSCPSNKLLSCFFQNTSLNELDVALPVVHNQGRVEFEIHEDVHVTPSEWSHIATTLLTSEDSSLTFDVRKYDNTDEAIMRLLPVIKISRVLRLNEVTNLSWAMIASTLRSPANCIREIDIEKKALHYINLKLLSVGMRSPNCKVEILRTPYNFYPKDADPLLSGILLNPTHLRELKLLNSFGLGDRAVQSLSQILMNPDCHLEKLCVQGMETLESCKILATALCSSSCHLQELEFSRYYKGSEDEGLQLLWKAFRHPDFKVTVLSQLQADSFKTLASALRSCSLKSLDLSVCGLTDSSVKLLSAGLSKPGCKLEILRMTHCSITEAGAACLARALSSNPSSMQEIDLSLNPVKGPGFDQLRSVLEDPATRLEKLIVDGLEEQRDMETLRQYACQLTWDPNTASSSGVMRFCLFLSESLVQVWSVTYDWRLGLKDEDSESRGVLDFGAVLLPSLVLDRFSFVVSFLT